MPPRTVLVMGATGKTGTAIARALMARGATVRGVSRSLRPAREGMEMVQVSENGAGLHEALEGVDAVHHSAPNLSDAEAPMMSRLLAAARAQRVSKVVFHSVMHPHCPAMPHHMRKAEAEHLLRTSGLDWTILQPAAYHQNLIPMALMGTIQVPYDLGRSFTNVDLEDIAEVSARALLSDDLSLATLELAGPQRLTVHTMAAQASQVLGRPIRAERMAPMAGSSRFHTELRAMFTHYEIQGFCGNPLVLRTALGREPTTWAEALIRMAK